MKKSTFLTILIPVIFVLFMFTVPLVIMYADDDILDMLPIIMPLLMIGIFVVISVLIYYANKSKMDDVNLVIAEKQKMRQDNKEVLCPHCGEFIGYGDRNYCPNCGKKIDDRFL